MLLASCDSGAPTTSLTGEYTGTFFRVSPLALYPAANVSLSFSNGQFSGTSDASKYPALCNGTFFFTGTEIAFNQKCFWTADFDWTLILSGKYQFTVSGDSLSMVKKQDGEVTDIYRLKRTP
jgi:hypothetical protein